MYTQNVLINLIKHACTYMNSHRHMHTHTHTHAHTHTYAHAFYVFVVNLYYI